MNKYAYTQTLFLMFVFNIACQGQGKPHLPEDHISSETKHPVTCYGPTTMVRHIKKGRNGTILIAASYAGVFRYDGKSFTNLTRKVGSHRFWDVLEDRRRNIWFASTDSGVYYYHGKYIQHFTASDGLAGNGVKCIYEDKAGNIWFGTTGGASCYDGKSFRNFTTKEGLSNNDINTIIQDKTGKLWFGTRGDACFYDGKTFTVFTNKDGKAFNNVWGITEDKKGNILFGADGLWRYDGNTFTKIGQGYAYAVIEDKKGNIWTTGNAYPPNGSWALSRYDANSLYNKKPTVTEITSGGPAFLGILEADDGSIWFGSMTGVCRYDGHSITDFKRKA